MISLGLNLNNYIDNDLLNLIKNTNDEQNKLNEFKYLIKIKNIINTETFFKLTEDKNLIIYYLPNISAETYIFKQINNQILRETFFTINTYTNFLYLEPLNIILLLVSTFKENKIHYYDLVNKNFNYYTTNLFPEIQNYFDMVYNNIEELIYFIPYNLNINNFIYFDCKMQQFLTYQNNFDIFFKTIIKFKTGCYDYINNIIILTPYNFNNYLYYISNKKILYFNNINLENKNFLNLNKLYSKSYYSNYTKCIYFFPEQSINLELIYFFNCITKTLDLFENNFSDIIKIIDNNILTILDDKELNIYFYYNNEIYQFNLINKKINKF